MSTFLEVNSQTNYVAISEDGPHIVVLEQPTTVEIAVGGPPGASGDSLADSSLIGLTWGTPSTEAGNTIEITGTLTDLLGDAFSNSLTDIEVKVSDSATDCEPSATATLSAASTPVGTILSGSGTATMVIRSAAGSLKVKVTETATGFRYLWVKQGGNARLWVRALAGVLELQFT